MISIRPKLSVVALALAVLVAGSSARAQTFPAQLEDLLAQYKGLLTDVATLKSQVSALQASNTALQNQLAAVQSSHVLALEPFVSVDPNPQAGVTGPNITFSGVNIHIVSGSGVTYEGVNPRGLGNLIIGYDEDPGQFGLPPSLPGIVADRTIW